MIALLATLDQEIMRLREKLVDSKPGKRHFCWEGRIGGTEMVIARTGFGRKRVEAAANDLRKSYDIDALLSMGFAGSLVADLRPGDVVVCTDAYSLEALQNLESPSQTEAIVCDSDLVELAANVAIREAIRCKKGGTLTVPGIIQEPKQKECLGRRYPAIEVEMEAYWLGRIAKEMNTPFLAVRSISDRMRDWVPDLQPFINDVGEVDTVKVIGYVLTNPRRMGSMITLGQNIQLASRNLTRFALALLPEIGAKLAHQTCD